MQRVLQSTILLHHFRPTILIPTNLIVYPLVEVLRLFYAGRRRTGIRSSLTLPHHLNNILI